MTRWGSASREGWEALRRSRKKTLLQMLHIIIPNIMLTKDLLSVTGTVQCSLSRLILTTLL